MKLRFTTHAVQDLIELADHLRARNPVAAQRVRAAIYETLRNLILFPKVGPRQTTEGVRKAVTRKYPYLIYYTWMMQPMRSSSSTSSTLRASAIIATSDP